jgi:hypothetical protein
MEVSGQLYAPAALLPGKEPLVPIALDIIIHNLRNSKLLRVHWNEMYDGMAIGSLFI